MRVMIVSDTHGRHSGLKKALQTEKKEGIDLLLHLGDVEGNAEKICNLAECETMIVRGNNDYFDDLPQEIETEINGKRVLLTHGHYYYVSYGEREIRQEAKARNFDIVMFGHTHRPLLDVGMGKEPTLINPGSIALPRQQGRKGTYVIMNIDEKGKFKLELRYV